MKRTKSTFKLNGKLLSIDPATKTGWAIDNNYYGLWDLAQKKNESWGIKLLRFRKFLTELVDLAGITIIAYEKAGGRNYSALISHSKLVGEIEKFCEERNMEFIGKSASEIKKFATGKGNSGKPAMISAAQTKLGYEGDDDNIADALWLNNLVKYELGI